MIDDELADPADAIFGFAVRAGDPRSHGDRVLVRASSTAWKSQPPPRDVPSRLAGLGDCFRADPPQAGGDLVAWHLLQTEPEQVWIDIA